jgi:hypothetical protein
MSLNGSAVAPRRLERLDDQLTVDFELLALTVRMFLCG